MTPSTVDAGLRGARDQFLRRAPAVRRGRVGVEIDQCAARAAARFPVARRRQTLAERPVFGDEQVEMRAFLVGELEEDLLAFGVLEALAVSS